MYTDFTSVPSFSFFSAVSLLGTVGASILVVSTLGCAEKEVEPDPEPLPLLEPEFVMN